MKTLKDYFDKIYVINYVEGKERREHIKQMFSDYGLINDIEFIYGMPFNKIKVLKEHLEEMVKPMRYGVGHISGFGCSFGHYNAIKSAYELGYNSILVLEDDIIIRDNIDLVFDYLDNIPENWNYLYFTPCFTKHTVNVPDLNLFKTIKSKWINLKEFSVGLNFEDENRKPCGWVSSGAYAMDRKAMELYIKIFEHTSIVNSDMIEYFYHNIGQSPLNMYTTKERLFATNNELGSLIIENNQYKINQFLISNSEEVSKTNFKYTLDEKDNSIVDNLRKQS
jgi:GR25 family glycosyltransferase involved in LPS biosynthesis